MRRICACRNRVPSHKIPGYVNIEITVFSPLTNWLNNLKCDLKKTENRVARIAYSWESCNIMTCVTCSDVLCAQRFQLNRAREKRKECFRTWTRDWQRETKGVKERHVIDKSDIQWDMTRAHSFIRALVFLFNSSPLKQKHPFCPLNRVVWLASILSFSFILLLHTDIPMLMTCGKSAAQALGRTPDVNLPVSITPAMWVIYESRSILTVNAALL